MTASQLASMMRARRVGKEKWMALCPAHPDRHASLSISPGRRGVLIRCRSNGCDPRAIVEAMGLKFSDLFYDRLSPAVKAHVSLRQAYEEMPRRIGAAIVMQVFEPQKRRYWETVESNLRRDEELMRCRLEPLEVYREWRGKVWMLMNRRQRDAYLEGVWKQLQNSPRKS